MYKILRKEKLNDVVELMEIHAPNVSRKCEPGQFIILRVGEDGERIPLTIADFDREKETITIIYQIVGYSTEQLAKLNQGDELTDFVGPLGEPTQLHQSKHVVGVAGGVGSAPLFPQLRALANMGVECDVIIGGREAQYVLLAEEFKKFCKNVYITTDDGSLGQKGFVTQVLADLIEKGETIDEVIAIGPVPMMKAVVGVTKPHNIKTSVSLNPIMIDGTGMCGCCRVSVDGKIKFACVDGPDFDGLLVDFDELIARQKMFKSEEAHICNLTGVKR
ncbi:MAG: sulfide/dihydroorotate dehydrogenase-like FAD/NAD-binding protein [Coprobacillus cateniformis]|nr:sulfide/dihydroorotate dehydrogenase-like FAD/NAD-binding protein [Longibaculum muris]MBS5111112.1 sulfide/dihydroorotate dehydrogenase-like FAD/NAD-binding protein [Coprobacillus cateniformis]MBS5369525.1 sulfide/dihydroorotate dehydrogenase-like FAD/NAD-binding protein [Coprobacillus cateniformis]MCR1888336.1 sulfide/dihydroorotate dehydrogenase-like FAD/NAD-binding protein [Longibaculum muris]